MNMQMFPIEAEELVLRSYQDQAVKDLRGAFSQHKNVVLQLPTGAGKTATAAHIIKQATAKGLKVIFCCDMITLIDQTVAEFGRFGIQAGVIQGDHPLWNPNAQVQVCSSQTLARRQIPEFDLAIIDEVHCYFKVYDKILDRDKFVLGLTATPYSKGLGQKFDELVTPISMQYLIDEGHLVDYDVFSPSTIDMTGAKTVRGDYSNKDLADRADKPKITGSVVKHWMKLAGDRKTIVFATNIAHANHLEKEFLKNGVPAKAINCHMTKVGESAKDAIEDFKHDAIKVLISVAMVVKGFDVPDVECLCIARPTKSLTLHVQMIGRGLRQYEGSRECLILDHTDNMVRLGFPESIKFTELDDGTNNKSEKKKKEREEPLPKACPSCDYVKPVGVHECPACGFEPENIRDVETAEGELRELKRRKQDRKEYTLEEKRDFLGGLNTYAFRRGFKSGRKGVYGWALNKYKEKFGCDVSSRIDWGYRCEISYDVSKFIKHSNIRFAKSEKGKEWAAKRAAEKAKQSNNSVIACAKCGSVGTKEIHGVFGPHKVKRVCGGCEAFVKWG